MICSQERWKTSNDILLWYLTNPDKLRMHFANYVIIKIHIKQ